MALRQAQGKQKQSTSSSNQASRQETSSSNQSNRQASAQESQSSRQSASASNQENRQNYGSSAQDDRQNYYNNNSNNTQNNYYGGGGGYYYGGGGYYHDDDDGDEAAAAAIGLAAGFAIGSMVTSAQAQQQASATGCSMNQVVVDGVTYAQCGSTWYRPTSQGGQVSYEVVAPPH